MQKSALLACLLIAFACKSAPQSGSQVRSIDDGGCSEYEMNLNALVAKRNAYYQNNDVNPDDASGIALYDESSDSSSASYEDLFPTTSNTESSSNAPVKPVVNSTQSANNTNSNTSTTASAQSNSVASYIADLNVQILQAQEVLSKCQEKKLGTSDVKKDPKDGNAGHCDFNGQPYDILNYNCHSAANESVKKDPANTGIISCGGLAPVNGSPAHHTFNYRREGNTIVYYNWGETCKAPLKTFPPDISDPDHYVCAQIFCGDQFDNKETQPLKAGQLVEEPGPQFCSAETKDKKTCDSCCQFRGKYWDLAPNPLRPTDRTFTQFMTQCYSSCSQTFKK